MRRVASGAAMALLLGVALLVSAGLGYAQSVPPTAGTATFTVTAISSRDSVPPISKDDVQLRVGRESRPVGDWRKDENLFLAILIDDSIDTRAAGHWDNLREFIMAQPATVHIALGYIRNNTTMIAQDFTTNHELAAKALRITIGTGAIGSSPYLGTMDMLRRWPETGPRRSVLLISSGIDFFRGERSGPTFPDVVPLTQRAQRQNTNIWTVYFPAAAHRAHSFNLAWTGQNNLNRLSDDTGGESFFLGTGMPVSLKPYFDEIATHLSNQYLLTFAGTGGNRGRLQSVNVRTTVPDVELDSASAVFLPPAAAAR
jgi:hypothetical protein